MKTDTLFYYLFQEFPGIFFELIGESASLANDYQFTSIELKQVAFRLDGLFLPPQDKPNLPIYFVEVQFQRLLKMELTVEQVTEALNLDIEAVRQAVPKQS